MQASRFTSNPQVIAEVELLRQQTDKRSFSDVYDAAGNQYVDLVMEGGGVLGIALVGYCYAMESAGIRFRSVAGTSAGAINAALLQAVARPGYKKARHLIREVSAMPLKDFQDGGRDARAVVDALRSDDALILKLAKLFPNLPELVSDLGINPGASFQKWIADRLAHYGIATLRDLDALLEQAPRGIHYRDPETGRRTPYPWEARMALVASELGTARKVVLPRHAALFYADPSQAAPADFVRASMSVPYFFEPFRLRSLPTHQAAKRAWRAFKPRGPIPNEAVFVDGGLLSNFPISEFHRTDSGKPTMPTFGVKLSVDDGMVRKIDKLRTMTAALISAMRFDADREFLYNNPDYRQLIAEIQTKEFHWLDFEMSDTDKIALFRAGVTAARRFIDQFDWRAYHASR